MTNPIDKYELPNPSTEQQRAVLGMAVELDRAMRLQIQQAQVCQAYGYADGLRVMQLKHDELFKKVMGDL